MSGGLTATVSLPAPTVTATSPSVTVTSPPLAATVSLPAPSITAWSAYNSVVLATSGLQSYWKLGESSGSTINDSYGAVSGTKGSAVTLGATGLVPSDSGSAVSFTDDATNAVVDLGNNYKFSGTASFSVEAWFKSTNLSPTGGSNHIIGAYDGTKGWRLVCLGAGINKFYFARYDSGGGLDAATGTTVASTGTTYHVVVTYDGSNIKLYVNGALEATTSSTRSITAAGTNLKIGASVTGVGSMIGTLDDISIYNTALSASTVAAHYAGSAGATVAAPPLAASVALPVAGTGVSTTAQVAVDTTATATVGLPAPGVTTSTGSGSVAVAAVPMAAAARLSAPAVSTGTNATIAAPPLTAAASLPSTVVTTTTFTNVTVTAPPMVASCQLYAPFDYWNPVDYTLHFNLGPYL